MTREECERSVGYLLEDIRNTVKQYDPTIDHISLAIIENHLSAFAIDDDKSTDDKNFYLLNVYKTVEDEDDD